MRRMQATALAVYVLLATSQVRDVLGQSVIERSPTNPLFYRVYNRHYALETDANEGLVGAEIIFYVSFKDGLFISERLFLVEIFYMDTIVRPSYRCYISEHSLTESTTRKFKNVFTFMFSLHEAGRYQMRMSPRNGHYGNMYSVAPDGVIVTGFENLAFTVLPPRGDRSCNKVGTFTFRSLNMDIFHLHAVFNWAEWTTIQRKSITCNGWIYGLPTWSIEMILHDICLDADNNCLNPYQIKKVNISEYTTNILNVAMPVPSREEAFVIMPYTFPPGIFRLCNTEMIYNSPIKHCAHLRITPTEADCFSFMEPMRITMTPKSEEFLWPLEDLEITVHDYFCLFAAVDAVYTGEIKYSYKWLCTGDILCQRFNLNTTMSPLAYNASEIVELNTTDTTITVLKDYMTPGTTVTISFYVEYAHPLFTDFVCHGMENRTVTFVNQLESQLDWRCHHNCWYYVNPELPLLVGFECHDCVITTANNPSIEWSISGLINETYVGASTPYLEVDDFGVLTKDSYMKFFVRVKVSYTTLNGKAEEIRFGKQFLLARNIQKKSINIRSDFLFETAVSTANKGGNLTQYFPQFSLNMEDLYYYVGWAAPIPVIATISAAYDSDGIRKIRKPATSGINGKCVHLCTDVYHVPLKDGNYSHCSDCTKYVTCRNGYWHEWNCIPEMEASNASICGTDATICSQRMTLSTDKKHYMKDYVITRTLWAPQSFVIELFQAEHESTTTTIQLELSSYAGLRKFQLLLDTFDVPRRLQPPMTLADVERMWAVPHETHEVIFIDKSYLIVIARALELTQIKRNPDYTHNVAKPEPSVYPEGSLTSTNETMANSSSVSPGGVNMAVGNLMDANDKLHGNGTFADINTILDPGESLKVLQMVETIIDALLNQDIYQLTFSNIHLCMASVARILNIYDYNIPIMEKALDYIHLVHDFHLKNLTEPASDGEIISHKLEIWCSLTNYFVRYRHQEPLLFELEYPQKYETALLETLYTIVEDISERQGTRAPSLKSVVHKDFVAKGAWLDVFNSDRYLHIHMGMADVTIDVSGLLQSPAFDYVLYTFVNIGAYTSRASPLPALEYGFPPNGPVVHLQVNMKHPLSLPLYVFAPGIYDIRYDVDFENVPMSTGLVSFRIYSKTSTPSEELTSDCYFFRVPASYAHASTVTIKPNGNVKFGVRVKLSEQLKDGLKTIYEHEIVLPQKRPEKTKACHGVASNGYSIFLPPLSLRQQFHFKSQAEYHLVIRAIPNFNYKPQDVSSSDLHNVRNEIVSINCVRASCFQLDQTDLINKYCRVTHCTGGIPPQVTCRCDRGYTFTANTTSCFSTEFDHDMDYKLRIEDIDPQKFNYLIPSIIVGLWCIFLALFATASKSDAREKMMGKTIALQGVFSPFSSSQYLVCFVTGFGVGCGTKSIPYMTIVGSEMISPRYKIQTSDYVFVSGSEIWLIVSVPDCLGTPKLMILSIESEDRKLSTWFVKEVYVRQIGSDMELLFVFNTWLPSKEGLLFAVDDAIPIEDVVKTTFGSVLLRLMRNQHPLVGMNYNIPGSRFSKKQHVLFCLCAMHILLLVCLLAQELPMPQLVEDTDVDEVFTVKVEFFLRATKCALISMVPIYLLGVLVETAIPVEPQRIEWRQEMKPSRDRRQYKLAAFDESQLPSPEFIEALLQDLHSGRSSVRTLPSLTPSQVLMQTLNAFTPSTASRKSSRMDVNASSNIESAQPLETQKEAAPGPAQERKENKCMKGIDAIFPLPIYVCLALMWAIIGPVTYYIFMLGFFFDTAASLEYLYVLCVAFIILVAVLYPFWLTVVALVNTVMFLSGKKSYGTRSEAEYRLKYVQPAITAAESMASLNVVSTRTRSLGELDSTVLTPESIGRSQSWCRRMIMKKSYVKKKYVSYSNWETILFIVVILVIINGQVGSVWQSYYQTEYVARALKIQKVSEDVDKALTYDGMWEHLLNILHTIISWKSNSSTVSLSILSAVKIRQIRAQPYQGDCEKDFPNLRYPRCNFDVEQSVIEKRTFANRWAFPISANSSRPGPFSYEKPAYFGDISTPSHTYPDGGYTTLFSWWSKEPVMLNYLRQNDWVDSYTKAVIISMNFVNVDSGLATIIEHIYEFRLTGIFMYTYDIYTFPLKTTQGEEFALSCLVMFLALLTVYFLINEIRACYQIGPREYFTQSQSWFLIFERVLSVAVLFIFFWLQSDRQGKLRQVHEAYLTESDGTAFIDFHVVSQNTFMLILVSSMLVIVCLIKVLARFRDYELLAHFVNLIPAVAKVTYIPIVFIIGFGLLGCLLLQSVVADYKSIYAACVSVTILLLKSDPIMTIVEASPIAGELFIIVVYCIMFFLILNYFIGLLNDSYSEFKHQGKEDSDDEGGE